MIETLKQNHFYWHIATCEAGKNELPSENVVDKHQNSLKSLQRFSVNL